MDLDFAFFHMADRSRQGLAAQFFLNRLPPRLFAPRIETLLRLQDSGWRGCNLYLPIGMENWHCLKPERQEWITERSTAILQQDCGLESMAVDRRLSGSWQSPQGIQYYYGHSFIAALALVLTEEALRRHAIEKIIVLGETPAFESFLEQLQQYHLPVSIQTACPTHYEVLAHRFLYKKGLAFSNSMIRPENWQSGDLILAFSEEHYHMVMSAPGCFCIALHNEQHNLAPELETILTQAQLPACLHTLAPILEACLSREAGFLKKHGELVDDPDLSNPTLYKDNGAGMDDRLQNQANFVEIKRLGHELDLWTAFLDKESSGLYNT